MEKHTRTILAGESSGTRPNHYGDEARVTLPNGRTELETAVWLGLDNGC